MSEQENAGTGAGAQTGNDAQAGNVEELQGRVAELEARNAQLTQSLTEQRTIQAGLDRSLSQRDSQIQDLTTQLDHLKTIQGTDASELAEARTQVETLTAQVSQLEELQGQLAQVQTANERLRILMDKHPELSYLAANDALPAASTNEEYLQKLDNIANVGSSAAAATAMSMLSGGRPPASPPAGSGDEDPEALFGEAMSLIAAGDIEGKGTELLDRYWALQSQ